MTLTLDEERELSQYYDTFVKMYGSDTINATSAAIAGEQCLYGLFDVDDTFSTLPAHQ